MIQTYVSTNNEFMVVLIQPRMGMLEDSLDLESLKVP